ncbi:ATP-binding cassette domain-containing protein [Desulfolucanica intricata]|uniref:ATP-binding cassette domain-containing protein n=1 Tax=Desulfolucanica intricata TaxID=1285191 RepID=UPI0008299C3E|nr:ABC transporter ATP-binding protein [Desulfolucanica intricata]
MPAVIEVKDLVQIVRKKVILNKLSFEMQEGECFGVFGTRGTGKTTLVHILAGIDKFKSGIVRVMNCDLNKTEKFKASLGLVTQEQSLFQDLKVCENLDFIATLKNADKTNILPLVERFELKDCLKEPVSTLEAGMYQRLSMACALLNKPRLLLVDELIDDLDLYSQHLILKELKNFLATGGSCLWAFKKIELCEHMNRVGWLENGQLTIYQPRDLKEKWQNLNQAFSIKSGE